MFTGEGLGAVGRDAEADQEALGGGGWAVDAWLPRVDEWRV